MTYEASILIPLLNQPDEWLARCVCSALDQTTSCEVIVIYAFQTCATNLETLDRIGRRYEKLRVMLRDSSGFANALNTGIRSATTERVGFLLADDWLDTAAVERCLSHDSDIVSTSLTNYGDDGTTLLGITKSRNYAEFLRQPTLEAKASYLSHFFLFKRSALLAVGGVDETIGLTGPDDYDLIWSLLEIGASVSVIEEVLYHRRDHKGQRLTLRSREAQIEDLKKILDKHGVSGAERERLIQAHSLWFGRPVHEVVAERRWQDLD